MCSYIFKVKEKNLYICVTASTLQTAKIAIFVVSSWLVTALNPTQIEIMKIQARAMNCPRRLAGFAAEQVLLHNPSSEMPGSASLVSQHTRASCITYPCKLIAIFPWSAHL